MKLKRNLFFLFTIAVFSIISVVLCISNYNPYNICLPQFVYFYLSVLFSVWGIVSIILFAAKVKMSRRETVYIHFWPAVLQALILSIGITILLVLRGLKLLDVWVGVPVMIIVVLIELFFQTKSINKKAPTTQNKYEN